MSKGNSSSQGLHVTLGLGLGALLVGLAHLWNGGSLMELVQPASLGFVVIATLLATFLSSSGKEVQNAWSGIASQTEVQTLSTLRSELLGVAATARKEGFLALENAKENASLPVLKEGIQYLISGFETGVIRDLIRTRISKIEEEFNLRIGVWETAAAMAPSIGALGATLGLLTALSKLDDPAQLGRGIAAAMASVLYGFFLSNFILTPIASRLRRHLVRVLLPEEMVLMAILSIQEGVNPQVLDERLGMMESAK